MDTPPKEKRVFKVVLGPLMLVCDGDACHFRDPEKRES